MSVIINNRLQRLIKKSAIKSTTVLLVFLAAVFTAGFPVSYSLTEQIVKLGELAICPFLAIMFGIPAIVSLPVLLKRKKQIEEITLAFQTAIDQNKTYSSNVLAKSLEKTSKAFSDAGYEYTLAIDQVAHK